MLMKAEDWEPRVLGIHAEFRITYFGYHESSTVEQLLSMILFKSNLHLSDIFGLSYFATYCLAWRISGEAEGTLRIQQTGSDYHDNTFQEQTQQLG